MRKVAVFLLFLSPAVATAQERRIELTPFIGYQFGGDLELHDEFGRFGVDLDESQSYGLILDIPVSRSLQVELVLNRQPTQLEVDEGLFAPPVVLADADLTYLHGGLLWHWGPGQVRPFVGLTAGVTNIDPDLAGSESETRFSIGLSGGAKIFFSRHVGLRLEARGWFTDIDERDDVHHCCPHHEDSSGLDQGQVAAGLILAF